MRRHIYGAIGKIIRHLNSGSDAPQAEKDSWKYSKWNYYLAILGLFLSLMGIGATIGLGIIANKLAERSVALSKAANENESQLNAINRLIEKQNPIIEEQQRQIKRQDSLIGHVIITEDLLKRETNYLKGLAETLIGGTKRIV